MAPAFHARPAGFSRTSGFTRSGIAVRNLSATRVDYRRTWGVPAVPVRWVEGDAARGRSSDGVHRGVAPQRDDAARALSGDAPAGQRLHRHRRPGGRGAAPAVGLPGRPGVRRAGAVRLRPGGAPDRAVPDGRRHRPGGAARRLAAALGHRPAGAGREEPAQPGDDPLPAGHLPRGALRDRGAAPGGGHAVHPQVGPPDAARPAGRALVPRARRLPGRRAAAAPPARGQVRGPGGQAGADAGRGRGLPGAGRPDPGRHAAVQPEQHVRAAVAGLVAVPAARARGWPTGGCAAASPSAPRTTATTCGTWPSAARSRPPDGA